LVLLCACHSTPFEVDLAVVGRDLAPGDLARIVKLGFNVTGAELWSGSRTLTDAPFSSNGEERVVFAPTAAVGTLTFAVDAKDSADQLVASGSSDAVTIAPSGALRVELPLAVGGSGSDADMAGGDQDLAGVELGGPGDLAGQIDMAPPLMRFPSYQLSNTLVAGAADISITSVNTNTYALNGATSVAGVTISSDVNGNMVVSAGAVTISSAVTVTGPHGLVIVAAKDVTIDANGKLDASASGAAAGPGATTTGAGLEGVNATANGGAGGGSYAAAGGTGGMGNANAGGGVTGAYGCGDSKTNTCSVVGGSPGGPGAYNNNPTANGGGGGGVIQISSATQITVSGHLLANGGGGAGGSSPGASSGAGAGGGSGGLLFLEAPTIALKAGSGLSCAGGGGGSGGSSGTAGTAGTDGSLGGAGAPSVGTHSGAGGSGGAASGATNGNLGPGSGGNGGGGGGSVGRIWLRYRALTNQSATVGTLGLDSTL
jgi:hypothetical protein